jgi:2-dehydropantoate 2-reductase
LGPLADGVDPATCAHRQRAMKVAVAGAGAMGSIFGAAFYDAGNEVRFVDVNRTVVEAINRDGLEITRRDGTVQRYSIPATATPSPGDGPVDVLLVQVKGFATAAAVELARPIIGPSTIILTLQNGLGNEEVIRAALPANPVIIGNSVHSVAVLGPGRVAHTGVRGTYIGPAADQWTPQAEQVVKALHGSDFEVVLQTESEIRHQIWSKFVMNCGSLPTLSLTGLATADANGHEVVLQVVDELVRETCAIARGVGIDLDPEERVAFSRDLIRTAGGKASMLQDIENGRRTEIDTINGAAVGLAERAGLPAPLNRAMVALVKGREAAMGVAS